MGNQLKEELFKPKLFQVCLAFFGIMTFYSDQNGYKIMRIHGANWSSVN